MKNTSYINLMLTCILSGMLLIILFNFIVDPLQFYRMARYKPLYSLEQRYQVPAMIRTHPFHSVVVGNSLSNSFLWSDLVELPQFPDPMTLSLNGSTAFEQYQVAKMVLDEEKASTLLWILSDFVFDWEGPIDVKRAEFTGYSKFLYVDSYLSGLPYLADKDTLYASLKIFLTIFTGMPGYFDYDPHRINEVHIAEARKHDLSATAPKTCNPSDVALTGDPVSQIVKDRVSSYVEPLIEAHQDKLFYFFLPPAPLASYSYLLSCDRATFASRLATEDYFLERLTPYKNVRFYDFRTFPELARDDGFSDFRHFTPALAKEMLSLFSRDEGRVIPEMVRLQTSKVISLAESAPVFAK